MSLDDRTTERDDLVEVSEDLVQSRTQKSAAIAVLDFDGLLQTPLHIYEDVKNGCGGQRWPAGMILAEYLLREHGESMKGCTMYDVCCHPGKWGFAEIRGLQIRTGVRRWTGGVSAEGKSMVMFTAIDWNQYQLSRCPGLPLQTTLDHHRSTSNATPDANEHRFEQTTRLRQTSDTRLGRAVSAGRAP